MSSTLPPDDDRTVLPAHVGLVSSGTGPARPASGTGLLPIGTRLRHFEITGHIGEGGFGIVYFAYDQTNYIASLDCKWRS